jgi:acyl carrier protein
LKNRAGAPGIGALPNLIKANWGNNMSQKLSEIVREEFRKMLRKDFPGDIDTIPISEMGIDSLDFFETIIHLEETHGIVIPIEKLDGAITLRDLIAALDD